MEFQKEIDINGLHELPYFSTSHILFCFESLLPKITLLVLVACLRRFSQEVGIKTKCQDLPSQRSYLSLNSK